MRLFTTRTPAFMPVLIALAVLGVGAMNAGAQQNTYPEWTKGMECWSHKDYQCCVSQFQKLLDQSPTNPAGVYYMLGLCQVELKQLDTAEKSLQKVVELEPKFGGAYIQLARVAKTRNQNDRAVQWITQGLPTIDPKEKALALKIRGGAYLDLKKYAEAEKDLAEAAKLAAGDDGIFLLQGRLFLAKKDNDRAYEALNKAYGLKDSKEAGLMLLDAASAAGKYETAARVGQALVDKGIKENGTLMKLGQAYLSLKDYGKSAAALAQIPGGDKAKLANLSQAYVGAKNWSEAEKALLEWVKVDPKDPLVYDLLGRVYGNQQRPKESLEMYKKGKAITGDPRFEALIKAAQQKLDEIAPTVPSKNG